LTLIQLSKEYETKIGFTIDVSRPAW